MPGPNFSDPEDVRAMRFAFSAVAMHAIVNGRLAPLGAGVGLADKMPEAIATDSVRLADALIVALKEKGAQP
jgi:hypothetical protein